MYLEGYDLVLILYTFILYLFVYKIKIYDSNKWKYFCIYFVLMFTYSIGWYFIYNRSPEFEYYWNNLLKSDVYYPSIFSLIFGISYLFISNRIEKVKFA